MPDPASAHGRLMNAIYGPQRHIYDVTRKYFLLGRDRLISELDVPPGGRVLEIACGTGRNLAAIGARYPDCRLYGFDISTEMLATARRQIARAGLEARTRLAEGDACAFDSAAMFAVDSFDRIVMSYSLSMIPDWRVALSEAARHLAPGGRLAVVDFGQQAGFPPLAGRMLKGWLGLFHVTPREDLEEAMQAIAEAQGRNLAFQSLYQDFARYGVLG